MQKISPAEIYFDQDNQPISTQFDDIYFSKQDGLQETEYVFLEGNQLWQRWQQTNETHFVIAETGFGTGLNFFATVHLFQQFRQQYPNSPLKRLFFISFEKYPIPLPQLILIHQDYPQFAEIAEKLQQYWQQPIAGCYRLHFDDVQLDLWFGDIQDNLPQLGDYMRNKIDAWLLDGFAPSKNQQMWNEDLYQQMSFYTKFNGTFATFTAASAVRRSLEKAGFEISKRKGFGKKRECLQGKKTFENFPPTFVRSPWYLAQPATEHPKDIAIIGGGIASAFLALSLLERNARITLYCADDALAMNASGNQQGAFYPQLSDDDERNIRFYIQAFRYGKQRLDQLIQLGIEFDYDFCGVALCAYNPKSKSTLEKICQLELEPSLFQYLSQSELSEKVGLPLPVEGGFIPQGAWLSPQKLVRNLFAYLQQQGVEIKLNHRCSNLIQQAQDWQLEMENGDSYSHQIVVLANGHNIDKFKQTENLPVYPVRGQVSQIPTSQELAKLKAVICFDGYLTPANKNQAYHCQAYHCLGASHLRDNQDMAFSLIEQQQNQQKIQQNLAGVGWVEQIDTSDNLAKVGIRCALRDRVPLLGNVPNYQRQKQDYQNLYNLRRRKEPIANAEYYPNLFILGALGSRGLTSSALLAEILASQIYNEPIPLSEDIWHNLVPNRSWMRKLLKGKTID